MRSSSLGVACFSAAVLAGAMAGCGTASTPGPAPASAAAPRSAASGPAPARVTLASEQLRLSELFRGTPVVFAMQSDGALRVSVPLQFSFDRSSVDVKPPLGAVLDRVAKSQLNETTRLRLAAAPDPGTTDAALAQGRARSLRDHLVARGVPATRLTLASTAKADGVEIVVAEASPR